MSQSSSQHTFLTPLPSNDIALHLIHLFDEKKYTEAVEYIRSHESQLIHAPSATRTHFRTILHFEGTLKCYSRAEKIQRHQTIAQCFKIMQMPRWHLMHWFEEMELRFLMATEQDNEGSMRLLQETLLREYVILSAACIEYGQHLHAAKCCDRLISLVKVMRQNIVWIDKGGMDDSEQMVRLFYAMKAQALRRMSNLDEKLSREARAAELSATSEKIVF